MRSDERIGQDDLRGAVLSDAHLFREPLPVRSEHFIHAHDTVGERRDP